MFAFCVLKKSSKNFAGSKKVRKKGLYNFYKPNFFVCIGRKRNIFCIICVAGEKNCFYRNRLDYFCDNCGVVKNFAVYCQLNNVARFNLGDINDFSTWAVFVFVGKKESIKFVNSRPTIRPIVKRRIVPVVVVHIKSASNQALRHKISTIPANQVKIIVGGIACISPVVSIFHRFLSIINHYILI